MFKSYETELAGRKLVIETGKLAGLAILILVSTSVFAQLPTNQYFSKEIPQKANKEFQFIAFYINQAVTSNIYPENDFLKGQVVGRLFGGNTTKTSNEHTSAYIEQRLIPFFIDWLNFDLQLYRIHSFQFLWLL